MMKKAVRHILDSVGAGVAGAISTEARLLTDTLRDEGEGTGAAPLWGQGSSMTPLNAALVNGTASHAFELDDTGGCDHSGAVVVPAAIAALELAGRPVSGREFIAAVVIGYDVARRPLEACGAYEPHNSAGFHSTGTCGPFGAAAAAARVYILPKGCIEHYYTRNKIQYMPIAGKDRLFHTEQEYMTQVQPEVLRMEYRELIEILNQACMRDSG